MVKKTINTLACALIAPLAFAQTGTTSPEPTAPGSGTITTYEPGKIVVVGSKSAE